MSISLAFKYYLYFSSINYVMSMVLSLFLSNVYVFSVNVPAGLIPSEQQQFEEEKKLSKNHSKVGIFAILENKIQQKFTAILE